MNVCRLRNLPLLFIFLFLFQLSSLSQGSTQSAATPGAPAGSYKLSDFDSVNLYSGNLNFNLPLAGLRGRGDVGASVSLTIDHQWSITELAADAWEIRNHPVSAINAGGSIWVEQTQEITTTTCDSGPIYYFKRKLYLVFIDQDGTETKLVDASKRGLEQTTCGSGSINYGAGFLSSDGGAMTFVADSAITSSGANASYGATGYLYRSGGVKSRIVDGEMQWTVDRNGNKTEFEYDSEDLVNGRHIGPSVIRDSIGREVEIDYNVTESSPYGLCHKITYKGFGGAERIIRVSLGATTRSAVSSTDDDYLITSMISTDPYDDPFVSGVLKDWSLSPKAVWLPDGRSYQFTYNINGRLAKVVLPTGGYIVYDFHKTLGGESFGWDFFRNQLKERRVYDDGNNLKQRTAYSYETGVFGSFESRTTVSTYNGSSDLVAKSRHSFWGQISPFWYPWQSTEGKEGKTEYYAADGNTVLKTVDTEWDYRVSPDCFLEYGSNPCSLSPYPQFPNTAPVVASVKTTLEDTDQVSLISHRNPSNSALAYDAYGNVTDTWYYDYGSGTPGSFLKREHTDYVTSSNYTDRLIRSLPSEIRTSSDSAGSTIVSRTQFEYDNYSSASEHPQHDPLVSRSTVFGHDTANYGTGFVYRGNPTAVTSYANAAAETGAVTAYSFYDILGNVVKTRDPRGKENTVDYTDNFGDPDDALDSSPDTATASAIDTWLGGLATFAFPTSTTNPMSWTGYAQYDYYLGAAVNTQDVNGMKSKAVYDDPLDRPTQTAVALTTASESQTTIEYDDDSDRQVIVTSDLEELDDNLLKAVSIYDSLGRTKETRTYETGGGYRAVETQFDALNRPYKVSNPFRVGDTKYWTETTFDALGRPTQVETLSDGAKIKTGYDGNRVIVTDQAEKQRISLTNALGQLKDIWEIRPASDSWTVSVSFPGDAYEGVAYGYKTSYSYDTLGNLTGVDQGSVDRSFEYDNLSRLLSATNPESGEMDYEYDASGNLIEKTDARGIVTSYTYDDLNRVTERAYAAPSPTPANYQTTPTVTYTYDNLTNSKGHLTKVDSSVSTTEYTEFDILGRVLESKQTTDGVTYGNGSSDSYMTYSYNLAGALVEQQYPSGRVIQNVLDDDGALEMVKSRKNASSGYWAYANNFTYNAAGAVTSMQLGNGAWESAVFNARLQPEHIYLGTTSSGSLAYDKLKLDYTYGTSANNGNVLTQTISFTGLAHPFEQTYTYDSLNRLDDSSETYNGSQTWRQDFIYDRYGNRNFDEGNTTTLPKNCGSSPSFTVCTSDQKKFNPSVQTTNNRLVLDQDSDSTADYAFDASGNTTKDADSRTFVYDAENKQVEVKNSSSATIGQYWYDGDGKRVKKVVPDTGEVTVFVYDAVGKLVGEYSTIVADTNDAKVTYLTDDHLGSPRVNTDKNGNVTARHDYHPFGEEIATAQRVSGLGYMDDMVRKQFTGYERDNEINLDYAQARYYNSAHGRFTSADDFRNDTNLKDAQSWNLYVYVRNNPLVFVDPTGMLTDFIDYETGERKHIEDGKDQVIAVSTKQLKAFTDLWYAKQNEVEARRLYYSSLNRFENSWNNLHLNVAQYDRLASALYAESSGGVRESYGIVNALENRAAVDIANGLFGVTEFMDEVTDARNFGVYGVNSNAYSTEQGAAADQKRLNINRAIALAIPGRDITNGAFFWDGRDFNKNARPNGGYRKHYLSGYFFTSPSHDKYHQGNYKPRRSGYYFESTEQIGDTTFSRRYGYTGGNWR